MLESDRSSQVANRISPAVHHFEITTCRRAAVQALSIRKALRRLCCRPLLQGTRGGDTVLSPTPGCLGHRVCCWLWAGGEDWPLPGTGQQGNRSWASLGIISPSQEPNPHVKCYAL